MSDSPARNHLKEANNPYLLQHAANPVEWYPWSEEAFSRAKEENKPIFLSIGYSSCHWCHVMAHESFEDPDVAAILNRSFISIKVDREERPDIDAVYMKFSQALTGTGGWPLTIMMTPEKEPFFAATYLPKTGRFGKKGLVDILKEGELRWQNDEAGIRDSAEKLRAAMVLHTAQTPAGTFTGEAAHTAFTELARTFDEEYGGFAPSPKFPYPHIVIFLLRYAAFTGKTDAKRMAERTLDGILTGGICDHIGGGFHRYSVSQDWRIPHFEKMLNDQAWMLCAYTEGYLATGDESYRQVAEDTATYLITRMQAEDGGFYASEDADTGGTEGSTYLWTHDELREAAGGYADEILPLLAVARAEESAEPVHAASSTKQTFAFQSPEAAKQWYTSEHRTIVRRQLQDARDTRPLPFRDEKILTNWNGLCIGALAYAGTVFGEDRYINAAERAAAALPYTSLGQTDVLLHSRFAGTSSGTALLDDYAAVLWGYLMLYEATFDAEWLERGQYLVSILSDQYRAPEGAYYLTAAHAETPLIRQKNAYDGALPSGNSLMAVSLVLLARITAETAYEDESVHILGAFAPEIQQKPSAYCHLISAYLHMVSGEECIILPGQEGTETILQFLRRGYHPFRTITLGDGSPEITASAPFTRTLQQKENKTTLYICREGTCSVPFTDIDDIDDYPRSDRFPARTVAPEH